MLAFYHDLIDQMQGRPYCPYWTKGVYPALSDIQSAVDASTMYVAEAEGAILGAFILNHTQGQGYDRVAWKRDAPPERVGVLHLLAVHPAAQGKGVAKALLGEAERLSQARGDAAIRLDTLTWNLPGRRLYEGFGFEHRGDYDLHYPTTGTIPFSMYELGLAP